MMRMALAGFSLLAFLACDESAAKAPPTVPRREQRSDPLAAAHAALRSLQFAKAIQVLNDMHGNADAQYLLGLMYLSGVGVLPDAARAHELLSGAANQGQGAAAFVMAGESARDPAISPKVTQQWLQRSATLGYARAAEVLRGGRPLWERDLVGAADPALFSAWVMHLARKNDVEELKRLGAKSAQVRDDFGRDALMHAAESGNADAAALLIEMGADVSAKDLQGTTALMLAAQGAPPALISLLLAHNADVNAFDAQHRSAAFYAARNDRVAALRALSQSGADLKARDSRGYNALDAALVVQADAAAAELRAMGVGAGIVLNSPGRQAGRIDPLHPGEIYRGWPPLALAVARSDTAEVRRLLDTGSDVHVSVPPGDNLLQVAADSHALGSIPLLLARGLDATAVNHGAHSLPWQAAVRADLPLLQTLLAAGVPPDAHARGEETPLLAATRGVHAALVQALLAAGADVTARGAENRTALMLASASGQRAVLEALLTHHADLEAQDARGRTALWLAAAAGQTSEVTLLLAAGAKTSSADALGLTPLHAAAAQPNAETLEALLGAHAAVNARGTKGDSALLIAASNGRTEVVRALLAHAPAINVQNEAGETALIAASRGGHDEVCRLLLNAGANRALRNRAGVAAADVATGRGFPLIAAAITGKN